MLYPVPYRDALLKHAPSRGVDPRFLLSIMRQESRFRPNVKSVAAARGLMQFIPDTSNKIAGELGRGHFERNQVHGVETTREVAQRGVAFLAHRCEDFADGGHSARFFGHGWPAQQRGLLARGERVPVEDR